MNIIPKSEIQWLADKLGDDFGRVFSWQGRIFRAIYPGAMDRLPKLFDTGLVTQLVKGGWLVPTERTDFQLEGFAAVLEHRKAGFYTAGFEWPTSLLRDAALAWIEINLALLSHGLALSDGHPCNFAQIESCRPVWLDLGSLRPPQTTDQGLPQFRRFFLNPLRLIARNRRHARISHALQRTGGIEDCEMLSLGDALLPRWLSPIHQLGQKIRQQFFPRPQSAPASEAVDFSTRETLLREMREELLGMTLGREETYWGTYQSRQSLSHDQLDAPPPDQRTTAILRVMESLASKRVIDLASNAGYFSFFAARRGAEVLALDIDEPSVELLYAFARQDKAALPITCAVRDITEPLTSERAIRVERRGDLVLALAITHHLCMVEGYTFEFVAHLLASYTTDAAMVEFMPYGRGVEGPKPDPLPEWYSLEKFLAHLRKHFATAEVVADNHERAWRILILCRGARHA